MAEVKAKENEEFEEARKAHFGAQFDEFQGKTGPLYCSFFFCPNFKIILFVYLPVGLCYIRFFGSKLHTTIYLSIGSWQVQCFI